MVYYSDFTQAWIRSNSSLKSVVCNHYPGGGERRAKSSACEITSTPCSRRSHSHVCHRVKCINSFTARIDNSSFPSSRQLFYRLLSISDFLEGFIFFLSMAQLQQGGQRALPAEPLSALGDSLSCQGVAGFEPTPAGDNVWCSLPAFQAALQKESPSPLPGRLLFEREDVEGKWKRQERWCSPGPCSQALAFSSLYLLSVTIKSHGLVISKLTRGLGKSEMLRYGGMENLLLCWRCSVWSCRTRGSKENNWNNRGFSWFLAG